MKLFAKSELVSFGNYLLSKKRIELKSSHPEFTNEEKEESLKSVSHADISNWAFGEKQNRRSCPIPINRVGINLPITKRPISVNYINVKDINMFFFQGNDFKSNQTITYSSDLVHKGIVNISSIYSTETSQRIVFKEFIRFANIKSLYFELT